MSKMRTKASESRLNFRLPAHIKERVENAALVSGITVTDFAVTALSNTADDVLSKFNDRTLTNRDRDKFLRLLDNPPQPNATLRKAAARYKRSTK